MHVCSCSIAFLPQLGVMPPSTKAEHSSTLCAVPLSAALAPATESMHTSINVFMLCAQKKKSQQPGWTSTEKNGDDLTRATTPEMRTQINCCSRVLFYCILFYWVFILLGFILLGVWNY